MSSRGDMKAYMQMEERYETLSLIYDEKKEVTDEVFSAIDRVKELTGMEPKIYEKLSLDSSDPHGVCIEFHDDVHRVGGGFFTKLLNELKIDKCERDI